MVYRYYAGLPSVILDSTLSPSEEYPRLDEDFTVALFLALYHGSRSLFKMTNSLETSGQNGQFIFCFESSVLFDWFSFYFHKSKTNVLPAIQSSWGFSWRLMHREERMDQRAKRRGIDGRC